MVFSPLSLSVHKLLTYLRCPSPPLTIYLLTLSLALSFEFYSFSFRKVFLNPSMLKCPSFYRTTDCKACMAFSCFSHCSIWRRGHCLVTMEWRVMEEGLSSPEYSIWCSCMHLTSASGNQTSLYFKNPLRNREAGIGRRGGGAVIWNLTVIRSGRRSVIPMGLHQLFLHPVSSYTVYIDALTGWQ
jgi:hypothetical protein